MRSNHLRRLPAFLTCSGSHRIRRPKRLSKTSAKGVIGMLLLAGVVIALTSAYLPSISSALKTRQGIVAMPNVTHGLQARDVSNDALCPPPTTTTTEPPQTTTTGPVLPGTLSAQTAASNGSSESSPLGSCLTPEFTCPASAPMSVTPVVSASPSLPLPYIPNHAPKTVGGEPFGPLHTDGDQIIDAEGNPVRLVSANWYGAESADFVPIGLDNQSADSIAKKLSDKGFNAVRLPWSNELVECNPKIPVSLVGHDQTLRNLAAAGTLTAMDVFDYVINALAQNGLYVILDNHTTDAGFCCDYGGKPDNNGLWWSSQEDTTDFATGQIHWEADWTTMVQRYMSQPAVIGVDLRNEPRDQAYWGGTIGGLPDGVSVDSSQPTTPSCPSSAENACDWRWAAQVEGNAVLAIDPTLLVFVEGTNYATDLTGAYSSPIVLNDNELVYSAHVYSFSQYCINPSSQASSQCPQNSQTRWGSYSNYCQALFHSQPPCPLAPALNSQWGYLTESGDSSGVVTPVWIGEFGTTAWDSNGNQLPVVCFPFICLGDSGWFIDLVSFLHLRPAIGWSYWALNGTQSDCGPIISPSTTCQRDRSIRNVETYGLLNRQWSGYNQSLLGLLVRIQ
jgi:endoglucanase